MTNRTPFVTLARNIVWSCPWYSVRRDRLILPNGRHGSYYVVVKAPAVWIIPVTARGQIALLRNYRHTVNDWCWEIPAGSVEPGQTLEEAARAELREEVGGTAEALDYLGQSYIANGISDEVGHFFLATNVTLGEPQHETAEVMEIHLKPIAEVLRMARANEISDAPSALALLLHAARLEKLARGRSG